MLSVVVIQSTQIESVLFQRPHNASGTSLKPLGTFYNHQTTNSWKPRNRPGLLKIHPFAHGHIRTSKIQLSKVENRKHHNESVQVLSRFSNRLNQLGERALFLFSERGGKRPFAPPCEDPCWSTLIGSIGCHFNGTSLT